LLLDEGPAWFRKLHARQTMNIKAFWKEIARCKLADPPRAVRHALRAALPASAKVDRFATRQKGGGSLGRPRFLVLATWNGGRIIREAKFVVPSAWDWALGKDTRTLPPIRDLAAGSYRAPDPSLAVTAGYLVRRIAPDAHKLDLREVSERG